MATPINKLETVVGVAEEVTEGTYLAPTDWLLPLPGVTITAAREELLRETLRSDIGELTPRVGIKSSEASVPLELKASGTEGGTPEMDLLLEGALGGVPVDIATQSTTKAAGNTATVLQIEDADIGKYAVGNMIVVLESGAHDINFITAVDPTGGTANITVTPGKASGSYSASVVVSKSRNYGVANSGHKHLSMTAYWGDTIQERVIGAKVAGFALENFSTGQLGSVNFTLDGLDFAKLDGSSAGASFSSALPPILLNACIFQDGVQLELSEFSLTLANEVAEQRDLCSSTGVISQRVKKRTITGSMNPYMDDTTVDQFDKFDLNTEYALVITGYSPSSTAGEIDLGSAFGFYLPQVISTAAPTSDVDDLLVDAVEFRATQGSAGTSDDIYVGFV